MKICIKSCNNSNTVNKKENSKEKVKEILLGVV